MSGWKAGGGHVSAPRSWRARAELISVLEIEAKLDDIRDGMKRDALVADQEHADPTDHEVADYDGRPFVRQLKVVGVGGNRVEFAKRDYYRAFTQRSRWVREHLVFDGEIARYELNLIEEWQPRFHQMRDKLQSQEEDDTASRMAGQELYGWVEAEARFPFRTITHRFLTVGSYHMLANDLRSRLAPLTTRPSARSRTPDPWRRGGACPGASAPRKKLRCSIRHSAAS